MHIKEEEGKLNNVSVDFGLGFHGLLSEILMPQFDWSYHMTTTLIA